MRGLSDSAAVAAAAEVAHMGGGVAAPAALALGGLAGVWSAALAARAVRVVAAHRVWEAREVVEEWDDWFLYGAGRGGAKVDGGGAGSVEEDVKDVVRWLDLLDALDSSDGAEALWEIVRGDVEGRRALVDALREVEGAGGSNVVFGVLRRLGEDEDEVVRDAARQALGGVMFGGEVLEDVVERWGGEMVREEEEEGQEGAFEVMDREEVRRDRVMRQMSEVLEASAEREMEMERVREQGVEAALLGRDGGEEGESENDGVVPRRVADALRVEAPLFDWLRNFELRVLCGLACLPLAYEAATIAGVGGGSWMRFVGLGWVLAVAGLLAYPSSDRLWMSVEKTVVADADAAQASAGVGPETRPPWL